MSILISASTNPPAVKDLNNYILQLENTAVDYIHCDIMDGHFVQSKTFGAKKVAELKKITSKKLDVHLMVKNPSRKIKKYIKAGAEILTVHYEAYKNKKHLLRDLQYIKKMGVFAGLAFNPNTSVLEILPYIFYCDVLLVMSVTPGKSGQKFMNEAIVRLNTILKFLKKQKIEVFIEVDGGVNNENLPLLLEKKVNCVVLGNYLYSSKNLKNAVKKIKEI